MTERLAAMRREAALAYQCEALAVISAPLVRSLYKCPAHLVSVVLDGAAGVEFKLTVRRDGGNAEEMALVAIETEIHNRLMVQWRSMAISMARAYVQQEHPRLKGFLDRNREGWAMSQDEVNKYWLTDHEVAAIYADPRGII